ncbi:hypothetical protein KW791_02785 [Candidatus Parcubacteria bacterium]|nr:hypothetical protein [Candidatus Parcubacteria bacterium]
MKHLIIFAVIFLPALFQLIVGSVLDMGGLWLYYFAAIGALVYLQQRKVN